MKFLLVGLAFLVGAAAPPARAEFSEDSIGRAGGQFLTMGPGARATALGEAYTAVADEASAVFWNPAGLAAIPRASVTLLHAPIVAGITFQHLSGAYRLGPLSVLGAGVQLLDAGKIPRIDANNVDAGSFEPKDQLFTLSYARDLELVAFDPERFSFGVSLKYLRSTIVHTATTWTFDLGVQTHDRAFGGRPAQLAFGVYNLAGKIQYDLREDPLPTVLKAAGSLEVAPGWTAALDAVFPRYGKIYAAAGTEFELRPARALGLAARAGINTQGLSNMTGLGGFAFGGGVRVSLLRVDYAFVPMGELGANHQLSLTLQFPGSLKPSEPSLFDIEKKLLEPE